MHRKRHQHPVGWVPPLGPSMEEEAEEAYHIAMENQRLIEESGRKRHEESKLKIKRKAFPWTRF